SGRPGWPRPRVRQRTTCRGRAVRRRRRAVFFLPPLWTSVPGVAPGSGESGAGPGERHGPVVLTEGVVVDPLVAEVRCHRSAVVAQGTESGGVGGEPDQRPAQ